MATLLHSDLYLTYWATAGLSEAMLRGGSWQLGEKGTHYIKTIKNSSHHLANIINDILDAAAFSKGRLVIKREKVNENYVIPISLGWSVLFAAYNSFDLINATIP